MKDRRKLNFCRGDWLAILMVAAMAVCTAAAFAPGGGEARTVQVYQEGRLVKELPLNADAEFEVAGLYTNVIRIEGGRARIARSDCPGNDCVHSGWIDGAGRSVVCLPNRVEIRVTGEADVDFTVR